MAADVSAYAALGLEPGADSAAIDQAYKRLIKQYHPDRMGGDTERAAEINRAYLELRGPRSSSRELVLYEDHQWGAEGARNRGWFGVAVALGLGLLAVVMLTGWPQTSPGQRGAVLQTGERRSAARPADSMDEPLVEAAIDSGIRDALRIARSADELALAEESRACHRRLRDRPSLAQLDRCAAFDDTVVQLQDRDPLRDRGPFSDLVVTRRQMGAGALLSNDYLSIDSRLDRIRLHVELTLAPPPPPPVVEVPETD